jgi:alkylation response protein AidB-like acyl-CoA dehydrogenase
MDAALDPRELRDSVRAVLKDHPGALDAIPDEDGRVVDRVLWAKMAELGWLGLAIDADYGGLGLGVDHLAVIYEELGRVVASAPFATTMLVADVIAAGGSSALKQEVLGSIAEGGTTASIGWPTHATLELKAGRVSGAADHVLFGANVDLLLLPLKTAPCSFVAVRTKATGVTVEGRPVIDLTRRMGRVVLSNVEVGDAYTVDLEPSDWNALQDRAAIASACDAIGGANAVFERTIDYLGIREQFGRPIGSFQALKHRAAHWKVQLEAASALVRHAATALANKESGASAMASSAKFTACDLYAAVSEDAIQLHGGIGFTWEHPCHLFLKRAKLNQQLFGSSTEHKERVARLAFTDIADARK